MTKLNNTMTAAQFNKRFSIGTRFKYYPAKGRNEYKDVQTRSKAWTVGHNETVVNITGQGAAAAVCQLEEA
jgi:hypothetical protein